MPQSIPVLTRDLIFDIASVDLSDMLNYIGVGNFQQSDSAYIRGNHAPINTDGAGDGSPSMAPDSWRNRRVERDHTGPLGKIGAATFSC